MADKDDALAPKGEASPDKAEGEAKREGWLSWLVGWILVPGTVIGVIFGGGALLGAHRHDGWFARTVVWVVDLF
jgi:hypothetical protein